MNNHEPGVLESDRSRVFERPVLWRVHGLDIHTGQPRSEEVYGVSALAAERFASETLDLAVEQRQTRLIDPKLSRMANPFNNVTVTVTTTDPADDGPSWSELPAESRTLALLEALHQQSILHHRAQPMAIARAVAHGIVLGVCGLVAGVFVVGLIIGFMFAASEGSLQSLPTAFALGLVAVSILIMLWHLTASRHDPARLQRLAEQEARQARESAARRAPATAQRAQSAPPKAGF